MFSNRYPTDEVGRRGPLRVMFVITSMPVGGAEMLVVNLLQCLDRDRFVPQLCCLKELGPLGETLIGKAPLHCRLLEGKYDLRVLLRLKRLLASERIDAVVTVGAGDKMFWGRLAAWWARVPVVCSALHSTGWPDGVGRLNRLLTPLTDAFIGVAEPHAQHLVESEGFPEEKVYVIPTGVDTERFRALPDNPRLRRDLNIADDAPVVGIVAALRPEKNHALFLQAAADVLRRIPKALFLIVGDGPERPQLEELARDLGVQPRIRFLGTRSDVPQILSLLDVFVLTSHNEANPVSILEAMSCERPVIATDVGSVRETVLDGQTGRRAPTGRLVPPGDRAALAARITELLGDPEEARRLGQAGREEVLRNWSLDQMVAGYENLIAAIYQQKAAAAASYKPTTLGDRIKQWAGLQRETFDAGN
jgi:glycosyltransferase involved in cell wall biosynthesis